MKSALQRLPDTERNVHLGRTEAPPLLDPLAESPVPDLPRNRCHGYSKKTVQGELGAVPGDIPRNRNGSFEAQFIGK